jgi:hypothetical protein
MSGFDTFDSYALGVSDAIRNGWPLSNTGVQRRIVAPGRNGGRALSFSAEAGIDPSYIRRGTRTLFVGRQRYLRFGCALRLDGSLDSFLDVNAALLPSAVSSGTLLCELRVSAERELNPIADSRQANECWSVELDEFLPTASLRDGEQVTVIEGLRYAVPAFSLYVNSDGYLRVIKGRYLQSIATGTAALGNEVIIGTSFLPMPLRQWVHLECEVNMGSPNGTDGYVYCWADGQLVLEVLNINFVVLGLMQQLRQSPYSVPFLPYPTTRNDCTAYRADTVGFYDIGFPVIAGGQHLMDDFFLFGRIPQTPGVPVGDLRAIGLAVTSDSTPQDSVITGSSPASTRWQSVATDDGDVTTVSFGGVGEDRYGVANMTSDDTIYAVAVNARIRKSDNGTARVSLGEEDADGTQLGEIEATESVDGFQTQTATFETDSDDASWTASAVNDMVVVIRRET